jgi:RNA binding exosome subunit
MLLDLGVMHILHVTLRTLVQATEDERKVEKVLRSASGAEEVGRKSLRGHFGNPMIMMSAELRKKGQIKNFMLRLRGAGIITLLRNEIDERMDDDCTFHFRLDKQKGCDGILALAETNDVIDCAVKASAYPAKKDRAAANMRETFQELLKL